MPGKSGSGGKENVWWMPTHLGKAGLEGDYNLTVSAPARLIAREPTPLRAAAPDVNPLSFPKYFCLKLGSLG
jgi:hypothetical protein